MFLLSLWWFPSLFVVGTLWAVSSSREKRLPEEKKDKIQHIKSLRSRNEAADILATLIERDGAGDWPPDVTFDKWPEALLPYKQILLEVLSRLSATVPSPDDTINTERRDDFRTMMRQLIEERVDLSLVKKLLIDVERDDWAHISRDQLNGFYGCLAISRDVYRWATLPIVKAAKLENVADLPPELELPWPFLQRYFGVTTDNGNYTSNILMNYDARGEVIFKLTTPLSPAIKTAKENLFGIFRDIETISFDIYYYMVAAIVSFQDGRKDTCLHCLRSINADVKRILQILHERLKEFDTSDEVWISYVQGLRGWGAGRPIDGKLNGLSSSGALVFEALDAFLGVEEYPIADDTMRHIPLNQRLLCRSIGSYGFGQLVDESEDLLLQDELKSIVEQLEQYRAANSN